MVELDIVADKCSTPNPVALRTDQWHQIHPNSATKNDRMGCTDSLAINDTPLHHKCCVIIERNVVNRNDLKVSQCLNCKDC